MPFQANRVILRKALPMTKQRHSQDSFDSTAFQGLLRNELAALEMYEQALYNIHCRRMVVELQWIRDDHAALVEMLGQLRGDSSIDIPPQTRPWGFFAAAIARLATIVGDFGLLAALNHGERKSESLYRRELGNCDLTDRLRFLIGSRLLPQSQRHLRRLAQLSSYAMPQLDS